MRKATAGTKCAWSVLGIHTAMDKTVHCVPSNTCRMHSRVRWQIANVCPGFIPFKGLSEALVRHAQSTTNVQRMVSIRPVDQKSNARQSAPLSTNIHTHIHTQTHTHTHAHTHIHTHTHTHTHTHEYTYTPTHQHTHIHTHAHTHIHKHACKHALTHT